MRKYCPLKTNKNGYSSPCLEKDCAWWSEEAQECCIKSFFAIDKKEINIPSSVTIKQEPNDIDHYFL